MTTDLFQCVVVERRNGRTAYQMAVAHACAGYLYVAHVGGLASFDTYPPDEWREAIGFSSDGTELYRLGPSAEEEQ